MNVSFSSAAPLTFQVYNSETAVARAAAIDHRQDAARCRPERQRAGLDWRHPRDGKYLIAVGGGLAAPASSSLTVSLQ